MKDQKISPHSSTRNSMETSFVDRQQREEPYTNGASSLDDENQNSRNVSVDETMKKKFQLTKPYLPWRRFESPKQERLYKEYKQSYIKQVTIVPAVAGFVFSVCSFGLSIHHFTDDRIVPVLVTCVFILIFVAIVSIKIADEVQVDDDHVIAISSVIFLLMNMSSSVLIQDDVMITSEKNIQWMILLLFLTYVTVPLSFWKCTAIALSTIVVVIATLLVVQDDISNVAGGERSTELAGICIFCVSGVLIGSFAYFFIDIFLRRTFLDIQNSHAIQAKMKRLKESQDRLLHSLIPQCILDSANIYNGASTEEFYRRTCRYSNCNASILFARLHGVEPLVRRDAKIFVNFMEEVCENFDKLCKKFSSHPIRYLGCLFKSVCGAPEHNANHAANAIYLGVALVNFIREIKAKYKIKELDIRVGIHTGEVESGIIGKTQWHFDVLGSAVDVAREIQRMAPAGQVIISHCTRLELRDEFILDTYQKRASFPFLQIRTFSVRYVIQQFQQFDDMRNIVYRRRRRKGGTSVFFQSFTGSTLGNASRQSNKEESVTNTCFNPSAEVPYRRLQNQYSHIGILSLIVFGFCGLCVTLLTKDINQQELFLYISGLVFLMVALGTLAMLGRCKIQGSKTTFIVFKAILIAIVLVAAVLIFILADIISMKECIVLSTSINANSSTAILSECNDPVFLSHLLTGALVAIVSFVSADHMTKFGALLGVLIFHLIIINYSFRDLFKDQDESSNRIPLLQSLGLNSTGIALVLFLLERKLEFLKRGLFVISSSSDGLDDEFYSRQAKNTELQRHVFPRYMIENPATTLFDCGSVRKTHVPQALVLVLNLNRVDTTSHHSTESENIIYDEFTEIFQNIDITQQSPRFKTIIKVCTMDNKYVIMTTNFSGEQDSWKEASMSFIEFVLEVSKIVKENHKDVIFTGGIHVGPLIYGLMGKNNPQFNVWGKAVETAEELELTCRTNQILVLDEVQGMFDDSRFIFQQNPEIDIIQDEARNTYSLLPKEDKSLLS